MASAGPSTGGAPFKSKLLDALDAHLERALAPTPASRKSLSRSSSARGIKPEPSATSVPQKRASDAFFSAVEDSLPSSAKKPKFEASKKPLSRVDHNTDEVPVMDAEDMRVMAEDVQRKISALKKTLDTARRKRNKSKSDMTRIVKYEKELRHLRGLKNQYNAAIPSAASAPPRPVKTEVKPEVKSAVVPPPPHVWQLQFNPPQASGSNVKLPDVVPVTKYDSDEDMNNDLEYEAPQSAIKATAAMQVQDDPRFDADGNFYGRGRDNFAGPVAKADDIEKFLLSAGNAELFDGNASVAEALEKLKLDDLYRPLPGMEVALMPHQAIGVAWMLNKELKSIYKGGCLGDEMGLGKTVQMIAVMVANRSDDPMCKSNLILAPVALLDQWQQEIEMKTDCNLKCIIYHGSNKPKKMKDLMKYDVVLTTYQTLALEWPDEEADERAKKRGTGKSRKDRLDDFIDSDSDDVKPNKQKKSKSKEPGLLLRMEWYRTILDESQNIRNRRTRASRAVTNITSQYRWCLTGTPIINSLSDVYGYLRFLRMRPWYDWDDFNSHIARLEKKQAILATNRLQAILATIMIRRKKDSMLDGKRLIELPPKDVGLVKLQFSLEERDIYHMVELKSQAIFNRFLRAGTVLKNYHQVLVLLLRLRQICSHPSLIQEQGAAFIDATLMNDKQYERRYELTRAKQLVSEEFVDRMKARFKQVVVDRMAAEKLSAEASVEDEECPICFDAFTDPMVTPCAHVFCKECIHDVLNSAQGDDPSGNDGPKFKSDERPCPVCRGVITKQKVFSRRAFEPTNAELGIEDPAEEVDLAASDDEEEPPRVVGRALRKRKVAARKIYDSEGEGEEEGDDDGELSDFIVQSDEDEEEKDARAALKKRLGKKRAIVLSDDEDDGEIIFGAKPLPIQQDVPLEQMKMMPRFLPSTKMKHMMELLQKWAEEHPDEKVLVISQWTQCLQLVSDYLTTNGFLHVKYQGDMNRNKRDLAVRVFMSKDKATIMLMSLKCGGVGLNLTRANRVISLDLGWSEAIESQAFDRVHRLGQTRAVEVHRLVIQDTVEDRVLALQERKKNLADGSLGEGTGKKIGRLTVRELANLFGMDHRGNVLDRT